MDWPRSLPPSFCPRASLRCQSYCIERRKLTLVSRFIVLYVGEPCPKRRCRRPTPFAAICVGYKELGRGKSNILLPSKAHLFIASSPRPHPQLGKKMHLVSFSGERHETFVCSFAGKVQDDDEPQLDKKALTSGEREEKPCSYVVQTAGTSLVHKKKGERKYVQYNLGAVHDPKTFQPPTKTKKKIKCFKIKRVSQLTHPPVP